MPLEVLAERLKKFLVFVLLFLLAACAAFCLLAARQGHFSSVPAFRAYVLRFGALGPVVLTAVQAIQVILPVLPGFLGCAVGAGLFGAAGGFVCNYLGISLGSLIAFWLAQRFGLPLVRQMVPLQKYQRVTDWVCRRKRYTLVLFLAILLPLAPDDYLCWLSGLSGYPSRRFFWIIVLGKPWCILAYSLAFARLF